MVSISHERRVESERRLRAVLRSAEHVHLDGAWCFRRLAGATPPAEALATVKDVDGWCALMPATEESGERFGVTLTTFASEIENSGYVGWIATLIRERLGSGVFVICGDNPQRGGIFDYLGYPLEVADAVRALIEELRQQAVGDPLDLDLRLFEVVETSPGSEISSATWFEFRERERVVEARYSGGEIISGHLLGHRGGHRVTTAYTQLGVDSRLQTGTAEMRVELGADGQLLLTENYTWSDGAAGRNVLRSVERRRDA